MIIIKMANKFKIYKDISEYLTPEALESIMMDVNDISFLININASYQHNFQDLKEDVCQHEHGDTKVVNVKVQYIRKLGYNNLKEWVEDPKNVYIGRQGVVFVDKQRYPKTGSVFANPFKINKDGDRYDVLEKYKVYMIDKLNKSPELVKELKKLRGKNLGCWCHPEPCHGDVLLELLDKY
jgi:hypothetical protein